MTTPLLFYYEDNLAKEARAYQEGKYDRSYLFLGAHKVEGDLGEAYRFTVWAPNAKYVNLVGDFNNWNDYDLPLKPIDDTGIWSVSVYGVSVFDAYKYRIVSPYDEIRYKADPYAFHAEERPKTASKVYDIDDYQWKDRRWMNARKKRDVYNSPMSVYEVNLSSWKKHEDHTNYTYVEMADELVDYVKEMGYTHVELMPITEYPYEGSWGYQVTGYFAPTSRFGTPKDFMYLVDAFHQKNIGVILDWVPVHFCKDDFGLARFDGTNVYEPLNQYDAENVEWGTLNFDYSKPEVVNFLISSALYWHDIYHIDGIRVDAVTYMLYLDFNGKNRYNKHGGNENLEAIEFLQKLNTKIYSYYPDTTMIAEESTAWPLVTAPVSEGGLGFSFKWNMGWMHDTLNYMMMDPLFRRDHQDKLTFSLTYAFSENYILPFSHDEVVHMKGSMINKFPGPYDEKFKQLRLLYAYMYAHPGKKLMFMGDEFAAFDEWNEWTSLNWSHLNFETHQGIQKFVQTINTLYKKEKALYEIDTSFDGFKWIEHDNHDESIVAFERIDKKGEKILCIFNFTPLERNSYPIGVDKQGTYSILLNTSHKRYGGYIPRNKPYKTVAQPIHGRDYSILVDIPSYGGLYIKRK